MASEILKTGCRTLLSAFFTRLSCTSVYKQTKNYVDAESENCRVEGKGEEAVKQGQTPLKNSGDTTVKVTLFVCGAAHAGVPVP